MHKLSRRVKITTVIYIVAFTILSVSVGIALGPWAGVGTVIALAGSLFVGFDIALDIYEHDLTKILEDVTGAYYSDEASMLP